MCFPVIYVPINKWTEAEQMEGAASVHNGRSKSIVNHVNCKLHNTFMYVLPEANKLQEWDVHFGVVFKRIQAIA